MIAPKKFSRTVPGDDRAAAYLIVSARSLWAGYSFPLAKHLEKLYPFPVQVQQNTEDNPKCFLHRSGKKTIYFNNQIQERVQQAEFNSVIDDVWVPESDRTEEDGVELAARCKLDLDKMLVIRKGDGKESGIGFWNSMHSGVQDP